MVQRDSCLKETNFIVAGLEILSAYLDTKKTVSLTPEDNDLLHRYKDKIARLSSLSTAENGMAQSATDSAIQLMRGFSDEAQKQSALLTSESNDLHDVSKKNQKHLSSSLICNGPISFWLEQIAHSTFRSCMENHEANQVDDLGNDSSLNLTSQTTEHKNVLSLQVIIDAAKEASESNTIVIQDSCLDESQFSDSVFDDWSQQLSRSVSEVLKNQKRMNSATEEMHDRLDDVLLANEHIVQRVNDDIHRHTGLELDASHEFEIFEFKKPPALKSLQLTDGFRYFLCLAEKVVSGDIKIRQSQSANVANEYHILFESLELLDRSLGCANGFVGPGSQMKDYVESIQVNNQPGKIRSLVLSMIRVAKDLRKKHGQMLKVLKVLASLGEVEYSRVALDQLLAEGRFALPYDEVEAAIQTQANALQEINAAYNLCQNEYRRQTKGWRWFLANVFGLTNDYRQKKKWKRVLGGMVGVSLRKFVTQLSDFAELIRPVKWAPGTELSGLTCNHLQSLAEGFEIARLQFTWRNEQYERALKKVLPRSLSPDAAFVNALCATASCDKEFDATEKKTVLEIVVDKFKAASHAEAEKRIDAWSKRASSQKIAELVAQAIVDLEILKGTEFLNHMPACLKAVVNADGRQKKSELMIYNAMMVRLFKD